MSNKVFIKIEPAATRLGNWMFQYAAAKIAAPTGEVAFAIPADQMKFVASVKRYAALWKGCEIGVAEMVPANSLRVGLYQDSAYLDRAFCRKLYRCPDEIEAKIRMKYGDLIAKDNLVSIHVRRGDYLHLPHRHPFVGKKYLRSALTEFPDAEFFVCSDDLVWCRKFFKGPQFHFAEKNDVLTDLFLMTKCRGGHICSNSTFSWWGAYLGVESARTIFPSLWYGISLKNVDWQGMYFAGSEIVENAYTLDLLIKAKIKASKEWMGRILRAMRS